MRQQKKKNSLTFGIALVPKKQSRAWCKHNISSLGSGWIVCKRQKRRSYKGLFILYQENKVRSCWPSPQERVRPLARWCTPFLISVVSAVFNLVSFLFIDTMLYKQFPEFSDFLALRTSTMLPMLPSRICPLHSVISRSISLSSSNAQIIFSSQLLYSFRLLSNFLIFSKQRPFHNTFQQLFH